MENIEEIKKFMLKQIADIDEFPEGGAHNLRIDGKGVERTCSKNTQIIPKENGSGIDIYVNDNVKKELVYIPVLIMHGGINDLVYNDFHIGNNTEVVIVAGCGIHNHSDHNSEHNGIHTFYIGENSKVTYVEKHFGHGDGEGRKNLSPLTSVYLGKNSTMTMNTVQMEGVDYAVRKVEGELQENSTMVVNEKVLTQREQFARSIFEVNLVGKKASTRVISRAVAKDESKQEFCSNVIGNCECFGHVECDAIVMKKAQMVATPKISALSSDARLIHEATIGKIAGEQLDKLLTLGLDEKQAEDFIIKGFLS